jgi:hypothetical protein
MSVVMTMAQNFLETNICWLLEEDCAGEFEWFSTAEVRSDEMRREGDSVEAATAVHVVAACMMLRRER